MESIAGLLVALLIVLGFSHVYLRRRLGEVAERLEALTRRIAMLEPPAEPAPPAAAPSPPIARKPDWEARIGGNWLNRLGVLITIIGFALFLGYSLTQLGPAGKIAVGYAASLGVLGTGVVLERRPVYRNFAHGLIAGGWAAVYFTTYALYGVPEARILQNPLLALALLLAVAGGMVVHSLRYRSQGVTALAYIFAFVALQISPVSDYALTASLPLAASVLLVARRFAFQQTAALGIFLTYATFGVQFHPGLSASRVLPWIYWVLFELFDLIERNPSARESMAFIANAAGFLIASLCLVYWNGTPTLDTFLASAAVAYLASAAVRFWRHIRYEPSLGLAALLGAAAILRHYGGAEAEIALLIEGELLVGASLLLRRDLPEKVGAGILGAAMVRVLFLPWTGTAALLASAFVANRVLLKRGWYYLAAASLLGAALLWHYVSGRLLTVSLAIEGVGLVAGGLLTEERVLRLCGIVLFFFCIGKLFLSDIWQLDTWSRIVSFLCLGILLVAASWAYTRYREQVRRLL